jgi:Resolvase, N terminal domain
VSLLVNHSRKTNPHRHSRRPATDREKQQERECRKGGSVNNAGGGGYTAHCAGDRAQDRIRAGVPDDQDLTAQRDALAALDVAPDRIYVDHGLTGTNRDRPGLREAMAACRAGDVLVVTKLDRLARSLPDARDIVPELTAREVTLSLAGSAHDPTDPVGRLLFNVLAMVAEFESDLIKMRTREGMKIVRAKVGYAASNPSSPPGRKPTWWHCTPRRAHHQRARGAVLHRAVNGVPSARPRPSPRDDLIRHFALRISFGSPGPRRLH